MKDIVIIGAGGFGREVAWLIEDINKVNNEWNIVGFVDDNKSIIYYSLSVFFFDSFVFRLNTFSFFFAFFSFKSFLSRL